MFQGRFIHNIDTKGRISIPAKFREIITERYDNRLILTNDIEKCIVAYPPEEWEMYIEKVKALPMKKEVRIYQRHVFSAAMEGELDRQGRILIPPALRDYAGLNKEVCLVGQLNRIEIWDKKEWEKALMLEDRDRIIEVLASYGL